MDNPLHIRVFCASEQAAEHLSVLGSLPATFRVIAEGRPDIALVGPDASSVERALASRPRALALVDPWAVSDAGGLAGLAVPVFPVLRLLAVLGQVDAGLVEQATLIRAYASSRHPHAAAMFEQLTALQALLGPLADVAVLSQHGPAYAGTARSEKGVQVLWSGQSAAARDSFELDVLGLAQRLEVIATPGDTARPADVLLGNAAGLTQARGVYESGLRLFWRHLAADLAGGAKAPQFAAVASLLAQLHRRAKAA